MQRLAKRFKSCTRCSRSLQTEPGEQNVSQEVAFLLELKDFTGSSLYRCYETMFSELFKPAEIVGHAKNISMKLL